MQDHFKSHYVFLKSLDTYLHLKAIDLHKQMSQVEIIQGYHTTTLYNGLGIVLMLTIFLWIRRHRKIIMFPYHLDHPLDVTPSIPSLWSWLRSGGRSYRSPHRSTTPRTIQRQPPLRMLLRPKSFHM